MRIGDLVKWSDPGKDAVGIVIEIPEPSEYANGETRIPVSFFSDMGHRIVWPRLREIELIEPRKIDESR
jgi:hypothetical protein